MDVVMSLGKITPKVVSNLKSITDSVNYRVYDSVSSFVSEATSRRFTVDRLIFSNGFVPTESEYAELNRYLREYSRDTSVLEIVKIGDTESEGLFKKYFESPINVCLVMDGKNISISFFEELVLMPIQEIRTRYCAAPVEKPKIGALRGGVKKPAQDVNTEPSAVNTVEPSLKTVIPQTKMPEEVAMPSISQGSLNCGTDISCGVPAPESGKKVSEVPESGLCPVGTNDSDEEDFETQDDEMLSVGGFGGIHSDTDMFDENDEELKDEEDDEDSEGDFVGEIGSDVAVSEEELERRRAVDEQNRIAEAIQSGSLNKSVVEYGESKGSGSPTPSECAIHPLPAIKRSAHKASNWSVLDKTPYEPYCLNFIFSAGNSGSAQRVVDDAVRFMELGLKVLIVDMDFVNNSLLSFINVESFYLQGYCGNFSSIYFEENVGVLSGGYGYVPSSEEIWSTLSKCINDYDIVIIDCPFSSLPYMSLELVSCSNIIVMSGTDPSQVVATSLALTSRSNYSVEVERAIMSKSRCLLVGLDEILARKTADRLFFANGFWLK
jgi:hypothetical protein